MSPLWGFGYLVYAVFYKHVAPLGLKASMDAFGYHVSCLPFDDSHTLRSFGAETSMNIFTHHAALSHVAPLGQVGSVEGLGGRIVV